MSTLLITFPRSLLHHHLALFICLWHSPLSTLPSNGHLCWFRGLPLCESKLPGNGISVSLTLSLQHLRHCLAHNRSSVNIVKWVNEGSSWWHGRAGVQWCSTPLGNQHKLTSLRQHEIITPQSCKSQVPGWFLSPSPMVQNQDGGRLYSLWEVPRDNVFPALSGYGQDSVPWGCKNEIPMSLLAAGWGLFSVFTDTLGSWPLLSVFKSSDSWVESLSCFESLTNLLSNRSLLATVRKCSPLLRALLIWLGPAEQARIISPSQGPYCNHICKVPFAMQATCYTLWGAGCLWGPLFCLSEASIVQWTEAGEHRLALPG